MRSTDLVECGISEWDAEFVNLDLDALFEVILAANYLDIKCLLDLACAKVASMIKGRTPEEIRRRFNILNDFTPEDEAQVREENRWCEDCACVCVLITAASVIAPIRLCSARRPSGAHAAHERGARVALERHRSGAGAAADQRASGAPAAHEQRRIGAKMRAEPTRRTSEPPYLRADNCSRQNALAHMRVDRRALCSAGGQISQASEPGPKTMWPNGHISLAAYSFQTSLCSHTLVAHPHSYKSTAFTWGGKKGNAPWCVGISGRSHVPRHAAFIGPLAALSWAMQVACALSASRPRRFRKARRRLVAQHSKASRRRRRLRLGAAPSAVVAPRSGRAM